MAQTLFLRDFTVLDFAFLHPVMGLQGESFYVSAELDGSLDEQGFILDFGPAKKVLKQLIDEALDHKLVVPGTSSQLAGTARGFRFGQLEYEAPAEAVAIIEADEITPAVLEEFLTREARSRLPENVESVRFSLREDPRFLRDANFRYTHGLRLHQGNCQRLLHGHRNPVEVWVDGRRDSRWEGFLAEEWQNAHFTYAPTLANLKDLDLSLGRRSPAHEGQAVVEYSSPQGEFRALIPASKVILLETEPSIENIARLGVKRLKEKGAAGPIRVVAYEGLNKGASCQD